MVAARVLVVVGAVLLLAGLALFIGNVTGLYPTVRFAGFMVGTTGGFIQALGFGMQQRTASGPDDEAPRRRTHPVVLALAAGLFVPMAFALVRRAILGG